MRIDWQAFDDGSLSPDEMSVAKTALRDDPLARTELDSIRKLKTLLSDTVLIEPAPIKRIKKKIALGRKASRAWPVWAGVALAALALASWSFVSTTSPSPQTVAYHEKSASVNDPSSALRFLRQNSRVPVEMLDLGPRGTITSVSAAPNLAQYRFVVASRGLTLSVSAMRKVLFRSGCVQRKGKTFFVYDHLNPPSIYWREFEMEFCVTGAPLNELWKIVDLVQSKTAHWGMKD